LLTKRGIRIEFVKEGLHFTGEDSPMANLLLSVMGAFAEFERALIRERQREGIALAKKRGAYRGRKKALSPEQVTALRQRAAAGDQIILTINIIVQSWIQYFYSARRWMYRPVFLTLQCLFLNC
jgi:DNA invertase Pin-like site-specific DNA recombinase